MELKARFEEAVRRSRELPEQSNDTLLELYGLYKQATEGDASGSRPGIFDVRGRAKFDAWNARRGLSRDEAMQSYAALVESL